MEKQNEKHVSPITIGLFGTCGNSEWRTPFISKYNEMGINFYNPQTTDWEEHMAIEEAEHFANDQIVLFPITSETYGLGSLSEIGFSILNAIKLDKRRCFVVYVSQELDDNLGDYNLRKESLRARALVIQHLKKLNIDNLYLVESIDTMLELSLILHVSENAKQMAKTYSVL